MCNLYANITTQESMLRLFQVSKDRDKLGNAEPLSAIFPKYNSPIVRLDHDNERELINAHWGFVMPQISKKTGKPIQPKAINNARDDKLQSSRFWYKSFRERRCLVPASSFCEARGRKPAVYHWFGLTGGEDRPPFAFGGLWRNYKGLYRSREGDNEVDIITSTVVTTTPNELVKPVHPDRMVVILDPTDYETWLHGTEDDAMALCRSYPAEKMEIFKSGEGEKSDGV